MAPRNHQKINVCVKCVSKTFDINFCCFPDILDDNTLVHFVACGLEPGTSFRWNFFPWRSWCFHPLTLLACSYKLYTFLLYWKMWNLHQILFRIVCVGVNFQEKYFFKEQAITIYHKVTLQSILTLHDLEIRPMYDEAQIGLQKCIGVHLFPHI